MIDGNSSLKSQTLNTNQTLMQSLGINGFFQNSKEPDGHVPHPLGVWNSLYKHKQNDKLYFIIKYVLTIGQASMSWRLTSGPTPLGRRNLSPGSVITSDAMTKDHYKLQRCKISSDLRKNVFSLTYNNDGLWQTHNTQ